MKYTNGFPEKSLIFLGGSKIFRILAVAIILSLLMLVIPASPALAASATLKPTNGEIGDKITITGRGYDEGERVYIYFSSQEADKGDDIEDDLEVWEEVKTTRAGDVGDPDEGDIDAYFDVPEELTDGDEEEEVHGGEYFVYTTEKEEGEILTKDDFTVTGLKPIDPKEGPVGTEVEIEGVGFDDDEDIEVFYDGDEIDIESGDDGTDDDGEFTLTIIIPPSTAGDHTIKVEIKKAEGEAEFTVEPTMDISPTEGRIGDRVTVTGTGYGDEVDVTITFGDDEVATVETDEYGSFAVNFDVPGVAAGTYDVIAEDDNDNKADAVEFTMTTDISVSPVTSQASPGYVGMPVTISGTGFIPNVTITITYTSTPTVFTTTSKDDGSFSYTFEIPPSESGSHTITASDGTNTMEVAFFMESDAPAIPAPLLPEMGVKAESTVYFDWEDVTDDSLPVTYTLQIATDKDFASIVLEKKGLTKSEYTITEAEKLPSTKKEAPYYWRVKAIDGASNVSEWTGTGSFYIGFVFELAGWILYTLMGVGGLLLLALGYWLGRRTAYSSF